MRKELRNREENAEKSFVEMQRNHMELQDKADELRKNTIQNEGKLVEKYEEVRVLDMKVLAQQEKIAEVNKEKY